MMKVFIAGSTGAIGRRLVPLLVQAGHEVVGLVRNTGKAVSLQTVGAKAIVADPTNEKELAAAVVESEPDVVINQLTAIPDEIDIRNFDAEFAQTNWFRTEATSIMLDAAKRVGARRFIAQSFCGWPFAREGSAVKDERAPLDSIPANNFSKTLHAIRSLEDMIVNTTGIEALALRYGNFYGPGTSIARDGSMAKLVKGRRFPLVGDGAGVWSFVHIEDAARATAAAIEKGKSGLYNIVDDEPAPVSEWLPVLANALGAKKPLRVPAWLARMMVGAGGVSMMTSVRGGSNVKAKRELEWQLLNPSWRRGFAEALS